MNWQFCPHCETELDASLVCPACLHDATPVAPTPEEPELSFSERYRMTDPDYLPELMVTRGRRLSRARVMVALGLLVLVGLYGSAMVYGATHGLNIHPKPVASAHR